MRAQFTLAALAALFFAAPVLLESDWVNRLWYADSAWSEPAVTTMGYIEPIYIPEAGFALDAKLDSGAASSSLRARVLNEAELNLADAANRKRLLAHKAARPNVRFEVRNAKGKPKVLSLPLVGIAKIKRKEGGYLYRPIVSLTFCLNGQPVTHRVNLAPRPNFDYAVLVGRNMLTQGRFLVDSSRQYVSGKVAKACQAPSATP